MDIGVTIAGIRFPNPVILASGPLSATRAALFRAEKNGFGGVVTKSATMEPCPGNPQPRWAFGPDFFICSDGLPNQGYRTMAADVKAAKKSGLTIPVIASVAGATPEEFAEMAQQFERMGADAIELNLGCPNRGIMVGRSASETMGRYWSETPERAFRVVSAVKEAVSIPVWAKFPYEIVFPKPEVTRQMAEAGADGLDFYASVPMGMAINLETGRPVLGNPRGTGIVSGHGMKPLGVRCTVELCRRLPVPVIASGGVFGGLDVIEYIMAGAHAVGVMTGIMQKVHARDIVTEAEQFLSAAGYQSLADIRGKVLQFLPED